MNLTGKFRAKRLLRRAGKRHPEACAIGVIGGADGPTAVFTAGRDSREFERLVERAAKAVKPNSHTVAEMEQYLIERYRAVPAPMYEMALDCLKLNVAMACYPEQVEPFPAPPDDFERLNAEQIDAFLQEHEAHNRRVVEQVERLHSFDVCCYTFSVPAGDKTAEFRVELERNSCHMNCSSSVGGPLTGEEEAVYRAVSEQVSRELSLYLGVTQGDIDRRTPRFLGYVSLLQNGQGE